MWYQYMVECGWFTHIHLYSGTCLIRHTKEPGKCVRLYRMLVLFKLTEILQDQIQMSQVVRKLRCLITQVPLY